ncbi:MAG: CHAT domain-containing protein [Alphaproteobacteria bacterium]|nr:CHAT domain-containing protein [Alphaproteobacteria bacterium]
MSQLDSRLSLALGSSDPATRAKAATIRTEAEAVSARLKQLDAILRRDHRAYGDLADPKPIGVAETQSLLQPDEAVVFILPVEEATFLFAVSNGTIVWAIAPIGNEALTKTVAKLRRQLDPEQWQTRPLEPFDRAAAHRLYRDLWQPLESVLADKSQVFVVTTGPLTSFPLSVLVTEAPKGGTAGDADPQALRDTAWLVKRHALVTLPSVSSLKALRLYANKSTGSEAFAGFGDPSFDAVTVATRIGDVPDILRQPTPAEAHQVQVLAPLRATISGSIERQRVARNLTLPSSPLPSLPLTAAPENSRFQLHRQSLPLFVATAATSSANAGSVASVFRGNEPDPKKLRRLAPLPATGPELRALAKTLGASETADVYVRERATEAQVKTLDLSKKRVIAFATHALMAGDMGLGEPGLVFTPPASASERDDGYLSASEVARLNLRADWIILSACNTAAGDTPGAAGLSGLARAFFLAGSKSLLVSHWPVWDNAAMRLTTGAVANMQKNPAQGRGQALRQSMLTLMNDKSAAYFAHPAAWAPFILVGETRAN